VKKLARKKAVKVLRKKKKTNGIQRFTQVQNLGRNSLTAKEFRILQKMSHSTKALRNVGLFTIKKSFRENGRNATAGEIDEAMEVDVNYWGAQSNSVQAIRRSLLEEVNSFFKSIKSWKENPEKFTGRPKFPKYLYKEEKRIIEIYQVPKVNKDGFWTLPMNAKFKKHFGAIKIRLPKNLINKKITYIEIKPKQKGRFFEVHYTYEVQIAQMKKQPTTTTNALSIDFGVDVLMGCATNNGDSFLVDGLVLKSINQYFNKEIGKLQEKNLENGISKRVVTNKQATLWMKRERQINGYISQAVGLLFKKAKELNIDTIVIGHNAGWKREVNLGKKSNQNFVQIPFAKIISVIENKCLKEGIRFAKQEESYTSKASFIDRDKMPVWTKNDKNIYQFSGKRINRGMYRSKSGKQIHADINGSLNILNKSKLVELPINLKIINPFKIQIQKRKAIA
jgi:IS605 OrfB family transposase